MLSSLVGWSRGRQDHRLKPWMSVGTQVGTAPLELLNRDSPHLSGLFTNALTYGQHRRSADFQSAVSQNCILLRVGRVPPRAPILRAADYKSAIQQIGNLRYAFGGPACGARTYVGELAKRGT